jgi:hypothetical protein
MAILGRAAKNSLRGTAFHPHNLPLQGSHLIKGPNLTHFFSFTVTSIIIVILLGESRVYTYKKNKRYGDRVMQRNPNLK